MWGPGKKIPTRLICAILLLWAVANFGPYLLVYLFSGRPYYQSLPTVYAGAVEVGLLGLNAILPLWWLRRHAIPWRQGVAWHRSGRRSWVWGLGGLAVVLLWSWFLSCQFPLSDTGGASGQTYTFPQALLVLVGLVMLWLAAVVGEALMFRGWMQTQLEARGPIWLSILLPALLFGLRHLPLDLYEGRAGLAAWTVRLLELYGLALVMGLVRWRSGSLVPTLVMHAVLWWLVILGFYGTPAGAIIGVAVGIMVAAHILLSRVKEEDGSAGRKGMAVHKSKQTQLMRWLGWTSLLVLVDQISKAVIRTTLAPQSRVPLIDDFLFINFVPNYRGVSWFVPDFSAWFPPLFLALRLVILLLAFPVYDYYDRTEGAGRWAWVALVAISAGVAGNLLDDLFGVYTVDFLQVFRSPSANFADVFSFVGIAALAIELGRQWKRKRRRWRGPGHFLAQRIRNARDFFSYLKGYFS